MEIKYQHEHIREALQEWEVYGRGQKTPAGAISDAYFALGMTSPHLYDDSHPDALDRNRQKIFRWIKSDTREARESIQLLMPAIEKSLPPVLLAKLRSYSSETFRDLVSRKKRIDDEVDALFGVMLSMSERHYGGGPAGNCMTH